MDIVRQVVISSICRICFYLKFEVLISNDCNLFKFSFPSIIFASFSLGPFLFNGPLPFFIYSFRLSICDGIHFCYNMHLDALLFGAIFAVFSYGLGTWLEVFPILLRRLTLCFVKTRVSFSRASILICCQF